MVMCDQLSGRDIREREREKDEEGVGGGERKWGYNEINWFLLTK